MTTNIAIKSTAKTELENSFLQKLGETLCPGDIDTIKHWNTASLPARTLLEERIRLAVNSGPYGDVFVNRIGGKPGLVLDLAMNDYPGWREVGDVNGIKIYADIDANTDNPMKLKPTSEQENRELHNYLFGYEKLEFLLVHSFGVDPLSAKKVAETIGNDGPQSVQGLLKYLSLERSKIDSDALSIINGLLWRYHLPSAARSIGTGKDCDNSHEVIAQACKELVTPVLESIYANAITTRKYRDSDSFKKVADDILGFLKLTGQNEIAQVFKERMAGDVTPGIREYLRNTRWFVSDCVVYIKAFFTFN